MPPVLGLVGTGDFTTDERPKNYRQRILLLNPNTEAPLTALLGKTREEMTDDPEFKIFEKDLPLFRFTLNGAQNNTNGSAWQINESVANLKIGMSLFVESVGEVVWVTAVNTVGQTFDVERGKGSTAASIGDGAALYAIGNHHQEGASAPESMIEAPTVVTNFTQIFRDSYKLTGTAAETRLRYVDKPKIEYRRETLERHAIGMELGMLFGSGVEDTSGAEPERTTRGCFFYITSNMTDFGGTVSEGSWDTFLESVFQQGSNEKLLLCGSRSMLVVHQLARFAGMTQFPMTPTDRTFGMRLREYQTFNGMLQILQHPLLSKHPEFQDWAFVLDMTKLRYRFIRNRDTVFRENIQANDADSQIDEYKTESGLELQHQITHGLAQNMTAWSST